MTNRTFSSITLLAFQGMPSLYTPSRIDHSVSNPPGLFCQPCARSVPLATFIVRAEEVSVKIISPARELKTDAEFQKGKRGSFGHVSLPTERFDVVAASRLFY
jgi:hypothetical protein